MNLTIKNKAAGTRSYLGGIVTVSEDSQTTISRDLNVIIASDAQLIADLLSSTAVLNNGVVDLNPGAALELFKIFAMFSTDKLATMFSYYSIAVNINQSAGTQAGVTVWSMRNPLASLYQFVIEAIDLTMGFDAGNPLTPKTLQYELIRFSAVTPTGGTAIPLCKMSNLAPSPGIDARFLDTGLTVTNVVFAEQVAVMNLPASRGSTSRYEKNTSCLKLAPGEGLAIRLLNSATTGQGIAGEIVGSLR